VQRSGLSFADRHAVVHSTSERIDAGPGDLDPGPNPDLRPNPDLGPDLGPDPDLDPDRSS
jgi:hypothetical protein